MKCARIVADSRGDLHVESPGGHKYKRVAGTWYMRGAKGKWFACGTPGLPDDAVARQVADYECCLRGYGPGDGPAYPSSPKRAGAKLSTAAYIKRIQRAELLAATNNIFASLPPPYSVAAEQAKVRAAHRRALRRPMPQDTRYVCDRPSQKQARGA